MESFKPIERKESLQKQILNALEISHEQEKELIKKIEINQGTIRIFIHPYYPSESMKYGTEGNRNPERKAKMQEIFEQIVASKDENQSPLFVFEESTKMEQLHEKLEGTLGRDIYLIPTQIDTAVPDVGIDEDSSDWTINESISWEEVKSRFKKWGVQKITIAGQSLTFNWDVEWDEPDDVNPYKIDGCVGNALNYLENDFEMNISHFNYPVNRKEYREFKNYKDDD